MSEIYLTRDDVLDKFDNQREALLARFDNQREDLLARIDRNGDNTGDKLTTLNTSVTRIETRQLTTTKTVVFVSLTVGFFSLWQFIEPLL